MQGSQKYIIFLWLGVEMNFEVAEYEYIQMKYR